MTGLVSATIKKPKYEIPPRAARRQTLFEIGDEALALESLIEEHLCATEGEMTPEVESIIDDWLKENAEHLATKADGYAALIKEREAIAKAQNEEAARLAAVAKTNENFAGRLKARLKYFMEETGQTKIETARYKLGVQNNGGKIPVILGETIDWREFGAIRPDCVRVKVEPDTDTIRALLEAGDDVDGAATLGVRGTQLRIR